MRSACSLAQPGASNPLLQPWIRSGVQPCSACARAALVAGASHAAGPGWTHAQGRGLATPAETDAAAAGEHADALELAAGLDALELAASGVSERPNKNRKHLRRMLKRQKQIRVRLLVPRPELCGCARGNGRCWRVCLPGVQVVKARSCVLTVALRDIHPTSLQKQVSTLS